MKLIRSYSVVKFKLIFFVFLMGLVFTFCNSEQPIVVENICGDAPNNFIKPFTLLALEKGIHVFAEKPPGINLEETLEMQNKEQQIKNRVLMFGFNHRHHGSVAKMKEIIQRELLGKVLWMRGRYGKEVDKNYLKDWRVNPCQSGGGIMLDQGIHMLDLFLYLGGDFDEVKAFVSISIGKYLELKIMYLLFLKIIKQGFVLLFIQL